MKLGPSSGPAVSSLEVYTTPALHGDRVVIDAPLREGVLQTLTKAVVDFTYSSLATHCLAID